MRKNYVEIKILGLNSNEMLVHTIINSFGEQLDLTKTEIEEIQIAVWEAVGNAIDHAYPYSAGVITICLRALKKDVVDILVKDKGIGIQDVEKAMQPMFTTGGSEHSGMGFTIMESFMTSCQVVSKVGKGTTVHMKKHIVSRRKCNSSK